MQRSMLFAIWLCFVVRGSFYAAVLPLWEGFDEWAHFAVAQIMSVRGSVIIDRNSRVSDEINASLKLAPLPRGITLIIPPSVTREQYWDLPVDEQFNRQQALQTLPPEWAQSAAPDGMLSGKTEGRR
jgi:hypothetical protein